MQLERGDTMWPSCCAVLERAGLYSAAADGLFPGLGWMLSAPVWQSIR